MRHGSSIALALAALLFGSCGNDPADPTPVQAAAVSTLIDADLTIDEQRCVLDGLSASGIEARSVVDGSLSGDDDGALLAVAVACVDDLTEIPSFVESFIQGAAAEGATLSPDEARCAIDSLSEVDATTAVTRCLTVHDTADPDTSDGELDLLTTACENGNNQACDELYQLAPEDSAQLELGRTCAGQLPDSVGLRCYLDLDG